MKSFYKTDGHKSYLDLDAIKRYVEVNDDFIARAFRAILSRRVCRSDLDNFTIGLEFAGISYRIKKGVVSIESCVYNAVDEHGEVEYIDVAVNDDIPFNIFLSKLTRYFGRNISFDDMEPGPQFWDVEPRDVARILSEYLGEELTQKLAERDWRFAKLIGGGK